MLRNLKPLLGYKLRASDGPAGTLHDVWFDDDSWNVRHFVAHVGHRFAGQEVPLPPSSIREIDWVHRTINLSMTLKEVQAIHEQREQRPVYRQYEQYTRNFALWATHWMPLMGVPAPPEEAPLEEDVHLRSVRHLCGYHVHGTDGQIGRLNDFIVDDRNWKIPLLEIDEREAGVERRIILPSELVRQFLWDERHIQIELDLEHARSAPSIEPLMLDDPTFEHEIKRELAVAPRPH